MSRSGKKKITWLSVMVFVMMVLFIIPQFRNNRNPGSDVETMEQNTEAQTVMKEMQTEESEEESKVVFPMMMEDGKLEVESVFQFSGINPDANKQEASDVAAIVLRNVSDTYLKTATIKTVLDDGTERAFMIYDLPAGKAAMAFAIDNGKMSSQNVCVDVHSEAVFENVSGADSVQVSVEGITVTLKNISEKDLLRIDVYCRDVFNDKYFGGVAHKYTIEKLPAGESTTVTASDCILGVTDVVRIVVNE